MGKTVTKIQLDYNNAIRQADSLSQIAKELRNTANKDFQDCISEISHNWTGSNATAYVSKCNTLKANIVKTADKLDTTATTIRKIAKNTYDAEMAAVSLATIRKY
jgi:uncharacterized protein YukE